jgi:hypothetical protein
MQSTHVTVPFFQPLLSGLVIVIAETAESADKVRAATVKRMLSNWFGLRSRRDG